MKAWRNPMSDYSYTENKLENHVHIIDLNMGRMSVTNDAENVLAAIHKEVDLTGKTVTYRDSEGQVDRLIHEDGEFLRFAPL